MRTIRTYIAGLGSGGSLVAAAVAGFIALGALVGFDEIPVSSSEIVERPIMVDSNAPEAAAAAAVIVDAAPAAAPTLAPPAAPAPAATPSAAPAPAPAPTTPAPAPLPVDPVTNLPGGNGGGGSGGGGGNGGGGGSGGGGGGSGGGTTGQIVDGLDQAVKDVTGIDLGLGEATAPVTDGVDSIIGGLINP